MLSAALVVAMPLMTYLMGLPHWPKLKLTCETNMAFDIYIYIQVSLTSIEYNGENPFNVEELFP